MAKKHKRRTKYTVLLVPDTPDKPNRELHALPKLIVAMLAIFLVVCIAGIGIILYQQSVIISKNGTINSKDKKIASLDGQIAALNDNIDSLKGDIISANTAKRKAERSQESAEKKYTDLEENVYNLTIPTGCPVTGTSSVNDNTPLSSDKMVAFETYKDANVIAAGNGKIEAVNPEPERGGGAYQYEIIINHGNDYKTIYLSNEIPQVTVGQEVTKGDALFTITKDTETIGYQIMEKDDYIDPWSMIEIYG